MSTTAIIVSASASGVLFLILAVYLFNRFVRFCKGQLRYGGVDPEEWVLRKLKSARVTQHYAYVKQDDYAMCDKCHIMVATKNNKFNQRICVQC